MHHCAFKCITPTSPVCTHCLNTVCVPQVMSCAGLPPWTMNISGVALAVFGFGLEANKRLVSQHEAIQG